MSEGRKYIIKKLQKQASSDALTFNGQKQIYFDAMTIVKEKLGPIINEGSGKSTDELLAEVDNLSNKRYAVDSVLDSVKKTLEFDVD